jgi:hypothetical protein
MKAFASYAKAQIQWKGQNKAKELNGRRCMGGYISLKDVRRLRVEE